MLTHPRRDWRSIARKFESLVGSAGVVWTPEELLVFECDGLTSYKQRPAIVVLPRTSEEVSAVLRYCYQQELPVVARGSGTGLSGGALPVEGCVLVVTSRMNRIVAIDYANRQITVQPGVINNWVTQAVSAAGFYYAPDPSSQSICSIGGNVAENSGGVHCLKYGVTTNHVLGLKVVLPDGEIVEMGGPVAEMPGYDLCGLFVGSEGTLGIATEITLRLLKSAEAVRVLLADFETIEQAGAAVSAIIGAGIVPGGMEIMDNLSINAVEDVVATNCYPRDAGAILLVEVDGPVIEVEQMAQAVEALCRTAGARSLRSATDAHERLLLWKGRKAAFAAMGQLSPNYYVQDGVIPRTQLQRVLARIEQLGAEHGYRVANVFHAGDGNLHPLILYDGRIAGELEKVERLGGEILKLCVQVGGSISGEHGIGAEKRCYMGEMFTPVDLETMQQVRAVFDPKNLANPTKIFPTPRTCGEAARAKAAAHFPQAERY
ncbi:FAD-linked oxidase C-terminal domain-containing protein [Gloeobacter kilaueensis]|uniref:Glycolate oxidase subunit GlcD n=1 Tax=Gloeobacter kilaueensis (strain ATCC BAA-2537 / CCAP 1431/1 / ULC 316 / JS1) TaxID=1183438 RepID=U5QF75_GLOK1|nr:glycolate oxidase subunit GlcD [Gloeobacter kilaueensis JS1]